jgi:hypothetical protein
VGACGVGTKPSYPAISIMAALGALTLISTWFVPQRAIFVQAEDSR